MKVVKKKLMEDIENPENVLDSIGEKPADIADVQDLSKDEIVASMAQGAADENSSIDTDKAEKEANKVKAVSELIVNPYGTARVGKIKRVLQRSLEATLRQKRANVRGNYQNVIIYGLAGFGKSAIVEEFCKEHNLNLFECDAKNLDPATVGGIPYPVTDASGNITQVPISSEYWGGLEVPNTVLFLDEINRATGRTRGSLLSLINNHWLPGAIKNPDTGRYSANKVFDNILFTVIAINPADDVFPDNEPLDPAMISRSSGIVKQDPDVKEFLGHLKSVYETVIGCKSLSQEDRNVFSGQYEIAKTILSDPGFNFDSPDDVRDTFMNQGDEMNNYLNYRTFLSVLLRCDGTKKDYLDVVTNDSGFIKKDVLMIKNCLATYQDKATTGNSIFNNSAPSTGKQKMAADDIMASLEAFANSLE